jgi:hypothetical protein
MNSVCWSCIKSTFDIFFFDIFFSTKLIHTKNKKVYILTCSSTIMLWKLVFACLIYFLRISIWRYQCKYNGWWWWWWV